MSTQLLLDGADQLLLDLDASDLPDVVRASLARHRRHIADLVSSMRAIGLPDDVVRDSVRTIVASYEEELVAALLALKGGEFRA